MKNSNTISATPFSVLTMSSPTAKKLLY